MAKKKKKENYEKYLIAGLIFAVLVYFVISLTDNSDSNTVETKQWSKEVEDEFVKKCYEKYQSQITNEGGRIRTNSFCKCMLSKMKTKYEQSEMNNIKTEDLRLWDKQCREDVANGIIY
jgi:hypothetical protein